MNASAFLATLAAASPRGACDETNGTGTLWPRPIPVARTFVQFDVAAQLQYDATFPRSKSLPASARTGHTLDVFRHAGLEPTPSTVASPGGCVSPPHDAAEWTHTNSDDDNSLGASVSAMQRFYNQVFVGSAPPAFPAPGDDEFSPTTYDSGWLAGDVPFWASDYGGSLPANAASRSTEPAVEKSRQAKNTWEGWHEQHENAWARYRGLTPGAVHYHDDKDDHDDTPALGRPHKARGWLCKDESHRTSWTCECGWVNRARNLLCGGDRRHRQWFRRHYGALLGDNSSEAAPENPRPGYDMRRPGCGKPKPTPESESGTASCSAEPSEHPTSVRHNQKLSLANAVDLPGDDPTDRARKGLSRKMDYLAKSTQPHHEIQK